MGSIVSNNTWSSVLFIQALLWNGIDKIGLTILFRAWFCVNGREKMVFEAFSVLPVYSDTPLPSITCNQHSSQASASNALVGCFAISTVIVPPTTFFTVLNN